MRIVALLLVLVFCDTFARTVADPSSALTESRPAVRVVWIEIAGDSPGMPSHDVRARVLDRTGDGLVRIEAREAVLINGMPRTAVVTAHLRERDLWPGNRISSRKLVHVTVTYTDAPVIPNQRRLTRPLSWIF